VATVNKSILFMAMFLLPHPLSPGERFPTSLCHATKSGTASLYYAGDVSEGARRKAGAPAKDSSPEDGVGNTNKKANSGAIPDFVLIIK
jgi:hypothetical protein